MSKTLGPFEVKSFLARGGMGDVYLAEHRAEGHSAAIKVVSAEVSESRLYAEAFLDEVRAAASLNHPSIVALYDYGEVHADEARISGGDFAEGAPWFAMEHASVGTLENLDAAPSWPVLRRILAEVLDALAHAHARGIVHRDLKPPNVLITQRRDGLALLLADFGIAHVIDEEATIPERTDEIQSPSAGTPTYMAPEQFRAQWRDWGPWTDLYAVGCLGWELATGRPPFVGKSVAEIGVKHVSQEPPAFAPVIATPPGFEQWLRRLLRKEWWSRYQRAADAAWALFSMGGKAEETSLDEFLAEDRAADDLLSAMATRRFEDDLGSMATLDSIAEQTRLLPSVQIRAVQAKDADGTRAVLPERPPIPADWQNVSNSRRARRTGLGLFGVREIPLVDRNEERNRLWSILREAAEEPRLRVVIVESESGLGKTKLLRWFGTRAHEVGAAHVLHANHASIAGLGDGLPRMIARHLGCGGLDRPATFRRIERVLASRQPGDDVRRRAAALTQLVAPASPGAHDQVPPVQFGSPHERYAMLESYLRAEAASRPVLLAVDDAQFGHDVLAFVEHLIESADDDPFPAVVVLAVRTEDLADRALERERLARLRGSQLTETLEIGMLKPADHLELVDELLGLNADLARELVQASGGDPMYSVCVVGDWVQRGVLAPGAEGYRIDEGADHDLPTSVVDVCEARFDRIAARFAIPSSARDVLQVAAALGETIDAGEWRAICSRRGVRIPSGFVQALVDVGLARTVEGGWTFAHGVMRDALERDARRRGVWAEIHTDCAHAVSRSAQNGTCAAERKARHFLEAERVSEALSQLFRAVERRLETSAYEEAIALTDLYLGQLEAHGLPRATDEVARLLAMRAESFRYLGQGDASLQAANEIFDIADALDSRLARAEGLRIMAGIEHRRGDHDRGIELYRRAITHYTEIDDALGVSRCAHGLGWFYMNLGEFERGLEYFRKCVELTRRLEEERDLAWGLQGLAEASLYVDDVDTAEKATREALELAREIGLRSGEGMCLTTMGNVYLARGRYDDAAAHYRAATNIFGTIDSPLVSFALVHHMRLAIETDDTRELVQLFDSMEFARVPLAFRLGYRLYGVYVAIRQSDARLDQALAHLRESLDGPLLGLHPSMRRTPGIVVDLAERHAPDRADDVRALIDKLRERLGIIS